MTENEAGKKAAPARLTSLAATIGATKTRGPAPVERWNPPYCGEIALRIAADGTWFYKGTPINRPALVSLFAGILRKDAERYVLVTPVERVGIEVEDVPFVAVAMERENKAYRFATNLGDEVVAGSDHPLRFAIGADGGIKPYVRIRGDLWARLTRSLAIDLLHETVNEPLEGIEMIGVRSSGRFFQIGPMERFT